MTMQAIRPVRNKEDYEDARREASAYFDHEPEPGSAEADRFEVLTLIIENYEAKHFPIGAADPVEALKFRMEQRALRRRTRCRPLASPIASTRCSTARAASPWRWCASCTRTFTSRSKA